MATIQIADNDARVQYTQAVVANTTQLTIDFPFFDVDDINVIVTSAAGVDTTLTRGTGSGTFAVTGTSVDDGFSGGYVTLGDSYADASTKYTIFRDIPVSRTTDFPTSGPFNISSLNTELDKIFAVEQELETKITRTMRLADSDTAADLALPNLDTRKGTVLAFNSTTGLPEAGPEIADVSTIQAITADIATLADIEDGTDATDAIQTVAGISSNVTTVAGIAANVTTVAGNTSNINAVAADATDIGTVATNIASVNTVAGNISEVIAVANDLNEAVSEVETVANDLNEAVSEIETVAASISNVDAVGTNIANVNTVAGIDSNVTTVAGISANVTTVAGINGNVTTVAGISSDVTTVAADGTDIGTVATNIANVNSVAGNATNINNVAGNATNINTVAGILADVTTVAGDSADIQAVAADATDIGTVSTNIANVNTVAGSIANVNTTAANITGVNSFAERYRVGVTDPTTSLDEGDLFFNTTDNTYKFYDGSSWQTVNVSGIGSVLDDATPQLGGNLDTNGNDINFGDNDKAIFGAGNDLQIWHNGADSYVVDNGTGDLILKGASNIKLQAASTNEDMITATSNGAVELYYDGGTYTTPKLATTATGVNVQGTVTADGLTIGDGHTLALGDSSEFTIQHTAGGNTNLAESGSGNLNISARDFFVQDVSGSNRLKVDGNLGDISFYDSTGTTQGFYWDASTQRLGLGTTSPAYELNVVTSGDTDIGVEAGASSFASLFFGDSASKQDGQVKYNNSDQSMRFHTATTERMRIDSSGRLLVGKTSAGIDVDGANFSSSGNNVVRTSGTVFDVNRQGTDGNLIAFYGQGNFEGSISVSGSTVSYIGGHLARWSRLTDNSKDTSIVKGTVMTNLDEMVEWGDEGNEQLNKMAVSSVEGDPNVSGVFVNWDDDDDWNDMNIAMTGDMVIRIAQGTTVARGELLMSAGDGTAKPQGDDIVRSKTIAKVTSTHVSHTYDDGSYLVPCVLMAC